MQNNYVKKLKYIFNFILQKSEFLYLGGCCNMSKKSTGSLASATLISLVLLASALVVSPVHAAVGQVTRTSGSDRYATAAEVATKNWSYGVNDVVLVTGEGYADAVSASSLAKKLDAPILLTTSDELNYNARSALDTLKPKNIYIVGGYASVSQRVRNTLSNYGYNLIELQGQNRYETNIAVAKKLVELGVSPENVLLVGGEGFSDALSVAPVAAAKGQILLLGSNDNNSMSSVINFVRSNNSKVTVVGTSNIISDYMYDTLGAISRVDGGSNRFETNMNVLNQFDSDLKSDKLFVANASGDGYADALVASALAGKSVSPLVLVDNYGTSATNNAIRYISKKSSSTTDLNVIGGTGVVSESIVDSINDTVNPTNFHHNTSPSVQSIEPLSLNQVKIHFNTSIDEDSAEDVTNYKIDGVQFTKLDDDGVAKDENGACATKIDDDTVLITFAQPRKQNDRVTVMVKKNILTEDKEDTIDKFEETVNFTDTKSPTVKKVSMEGNSQLTVEFSEAVNMETISSLKSKFKIDGRSIGSYSVNTEYSKIKDCVKVKDSSYGLVGTWSNKLTFYFDSKIESGSHTLTISDGDGDNGLLDTAARFPFEETTENFEVDSMSSDPVIKSIKETSSGEIHITFDRPMDIQTAVDLSNYKVNDKKLSSINGAYIETDDNDTVIELKHVRGNTIETGSNTVYISEHVKDAFGNNIDDGIRKSFEHDNDDTKPDVESVSIVDSETIRVRFSKDVDYSYATNISNYKLKDNKGIDITDHIKDIYSTSGESDTSDTDCFNINLYRHDPDDANDDWRLTGSKYTLTIKNIIDTSSTPNSMDDYTYNISGNDDTAPSGVGIYSKLRDSSDTNKDKVIVYFSEPMDTATITDRHNYQFIDGEGDTNSLPSGATISTGGDDKSAIIEFPSSYHVKTTGVTSSGSDTDVTAISVFNVKDEDGNTLSGIAYNNNNKIDKTQGGAEVKNKTLRVYYYGNDLRADVQFNKAIDEVTPSDFTLGGINPSTATIDGSKVILIFKEGAKATNEEKSAHPITYANGKTNEVPTKIELVKAQGQDVRLAIASTGTIDETGAKVSRDENDNIIDLPYDKASVYDYEAGPRTTCSDDSDADYWTATKDSNGAKVYITFDTILDPNSGIDTDDFTFAGINGTNIKADAVSVDGTTLIFSFKSDNKNYKAFNGSTLDIRAKNSISLRTKKDADDNYAKYEPSSDDLRSRTITITDNSVVTPVVGSVDLSTLKADTASVPYTTVVTFKLNVTDPANYTVNVKGVDATFSSATNTFGAAVGGNYAAAQFTAADFVVTKKTTTAASTLEGAVLIDAVGTDSAGKTQFNFSGVTKINVTDIFKYIISTTGSAVPTPKVGDDLSSWTTSIDGTTVTVTDGTHIGIAEVDDTGKAVRFVDKTAVVKN
jgi:putative cell wall-binding protein